MSGKPSPVARIVKAFGGQNAMARSLGIKQSTVWGWTKSGRIPYDRIPAVVEAARQLRDPLELTAADFVEISTPAEAA